MLRTRPIQLAFIALTLATSSRADIGAWTAPEGRAESQMLGSNRCEECGFGRGITGRPEDIRPTCASRYQSRGWHLRCEERTKSGYYDVWCDGPPRALVTKAEYEAYLRQQRRPWLWAL